jgi:hypothetical protein
MVGKNWGIANSRCKFIGLDCSYYIHQTDSGDTKIDVRLFTDSSKQDTPGSLRAL